MPSTPSRPAPSGRALPGFAFHRPLGGVRPALASVTGRGLALVLALTLGSLPLASCGGAAPVGLRVLPGSTQAPNPEGVGEVVERPYFHTFGEVPWGDTATHTFRIENTERRPISITRITPGCSCTVPRLVAVSPSGERVPGDPGDPERLLTIPPGWVAEVELAVDTRGREVVTNVEKLIVVRINSDSELTPYTKLEMNLKVVRPLVLEPDAFNIDRVPVSVGGKAIVRIISREPHDMEPVAVVSVPEGVEADLYPDPARAGGFWILSARVVEGLEPGPLLGAIQVSTTRGGRPSLPLSVPLRCQVVPDLAVEPARLVLRPSLDDGPSERSASLFFRLPGRTFRVQRVGLVGDEREVLEVEALPFDPNEDGSSDRWDITLRLAGEPSETTFSGEIELTLMGIDRDPEVPTSFRIPYDGLFP